jgi:alpha-mannosidase
MCQGGKVKRTKYWVVGSTHIDLAWKKDSLEMAELLETFVVRLLDILETNPTFTYIIEQAGHYRTLAERRPDLIAQLKRFLQEGRLEFVGGLVSTSETNIPNGESFVRNQILGLEWIRSNLGADVKTGWLVDTFGLNAQIPQILKQFGFHHLVANRFGGMMSYDTFFMEGLDGSRILVVGRDVHCPYVRPGNIFFRYVLSWDDIDKLFEEASAAKGSGPYLVMPYTENEVLPSLRSAYHISQKNRDRSEEWCFATLREYFRVLESEETSWPVVFGDLNPEFTGTFSQRVIIRLRNREVETLLLEAEKWASLLGLKGEWQEELKQAWWDVVFNHAHDIITGSHPTKVLRETLDRFERAERRAWKVLEQALKTCLLVDRSDSKEQGRITVLVVNGLPWARKDVVSLPLPEEIGGIRRVSSGEDVVPFETVGESLRFVAEVPSVGVRTFVVEYDPGKETARNSLLYNWQRVEKAAIENEYIYLECGTSGGIQQLIWKQTGEPLITDCRDFLVVQEDRGSFQIEEPFGSEIGCSARGFEVYEYEGLGLTKRLAITGSFPEIPWAGKGNFLKWRVEFSLLLGQPRLDVVLRIDWKGEASRIRFKLSTNVDSSEGVYEIPFGIVRRKPYRDRGTARGEWPAQRFVAIEGRGYGLALVNTGIIGVEVSGGTLWTTLLRAPKSEYAGMVPDDTSSQHGTHIFRFAIVPYHGTWAKAGVLRVAQEVNIPLRAVVIGTSLDGSISHSFLELNPDTVVLSAVKNVEDGSGELIVRFYESTGQACYASLVLPGAKEVWLSDLQERKIGTLPCMNGYVKVPVKPFEIVTLRISR